MCGWSDNDLNTLFDILSPMCLFPCKVLHIVKRDMTGGRHRKTGIVEFGRKHS